MAAWRAWSLTSRQNCFDCWWTFYRAMLYHDIKRYHFWAFLWMKDVQLMDWPCSSEHRGLMWCSRLRHHYVACKCCTQHDVESQLCSCESNIAGPNLMTHGATSHWVTSLSTMCIFEMCHFGILVCSIRYIHVISNLMWLAFGRVGRVSFCDSVQERRRGIQHRRSGGAQTTYTSCGSFGNIFCTWRRSIASSVASKLRPDGVLIYGISSYHVISHHHMTKVSSGASSASKSIGDKWVQFVSLAACSTVSVLFVSNLRSSKRCTDASAFDDQRLRSLEQRSELECEKREKRENREVPQNGQTVHRLPQISNHRNCASPDQFASLWNHVTPCQVCQLRKRNTSLMLRYAKIMDQVVQRLNFVWDLSDCSKGIWLLCF